MVAIGDGANDLPMMRAAGTGIAYRAKAVVQQQVLTACEMCVGGGRPVGRGGG